MILTVGPSGKGKTIETVKRLVVVRSLRGERDEQVELRRSGGLVKVFCMNL